MARLKTLAPRIKTLEQSYGRQARIVNPLQTERIRGRRLQEIRELRLRRDPLCANIDKHGPRAATQVDHTIPLWEGGRDDESNRQNLCDDCHAEKTADEAKRRAGE
jgi:5-methylcytosine-specific restriction protein A